MSESHPTAGGSAKPDTSVAHRARVRNHRTGGKDDHEADQRVHEHVAGMFCPAGATG